MDVQKLDAVDHLHSSYVDDDMVVFISLFTSVINLYSATPECTRVMASSEKINLAVNRLNKYFILLNL